MKRSVRFCIVLIVVLTALALLVSCSQQDELQKQGYKFNEATDWYEKEGEVTTEGTEVEGTFINLTKSETDINKTYVVNENQNRVVFIGNSSRIYTNFSIKISGRYSDVTVELRNLKFNAPESTVGLDASDVNPDFTVYIIASGTSAIRGGNGKNGAAGKSYKIDNGAKNPGNGQEGEVGEAGSDAIKGNNIYLTTSNSSTLTLTGGNGGNGGRGGDGEGSKQDGIGHAGNAANGGIGGNGGSGLDVTTRLSIENNGIITMIGGNGGNGGDGGHGGNNRDTGFTDRADHAGHGGSGGDGGNGGYGLYVADEAHVRVSADFATMYGGKGGNGGNGNDGGNSCKNELQSSKGGSPGNAGNGGNGGDGGRSAYNIDQTLYKAKTSEGGLGGKKGNPGRNPEIGYGAEGHDGTNGASGSN